MGKASPLADLAQLDPDFRINPRATITGDVQSAIPATPRILAGRASPSALLLQLLRREREPLEGREALPHVAVPDSLAAEDQVLARHR